jgi:hypothetical protein
MAIVIVSQERLFDIWLIVMFIILRKEKTEGNLPV